MTDCTLIKNDLMLIMGIDSEEADKYDSFIVNAASFVSSVLSRAEQENDGRIVRLCAAKAYPLIMLSAQGDDIVSFKAGDISYTRSAGSLDNAKELYAIALEDCGGLIEGGSFAFKAV